MLDMIWVVCYICEVDKGLEFIKMFYDLGYEILFNIMVLFSVLEN